MFGLFMTLLHIGARTKTSFDNRFREIENKKKSIKEGRTFYLDRHGSMRHVEDDEPFKLYKCPETGDVWEINPYTFEYKKNLSAEKRKKMEEERKIEAIENGERFYTFEKVSKIYKNHSCQGARYKDVKTGNIYVKRYIWMICCYLNTDTGLFDYVELNESNRNILKGTDKYLGINVENASLEELKNAFYNYLNKRQLDSIKKGNIDWRNGNKS